MRQFHATLITIAAFFAAWFVLLSDALPFHLSDSVTQVISVLPWWLLVSFGCYSLASIGYNLLIFRECPSALPSLEADLKRARVHLTQKGFKFE